MLEPLGRSQVLAYLKPLASTHHICLLSFEKANDWADHSARDRLIEEIRGTGIVWRPLRYHKTPSALATSYDLAVGAVVGTWLVLRHRLNIVHARSYVPSVIALMLKRLTGVKYIFDMRGFWADERVDGGLWASGGTMYRVAKWFERRFFLAADHVISLTHAGVDEIRKFEFLREKMPPFTVIPTCADLRLFVPANVGRTRTPFVLGHVGSAGTWYLFREAVRCFVRLRGLRPDARFLIVNRGEHDFIRQQLAAENVPMSAVELTSAQHEDIPAHMARMHAGIFFIKPVFSKQASAPTKLAEFLGCGIPCIGNTGIGDMATVLEGEAVGVALSSFDEAAVTAGLVSLLALTEQADTSSRCVAAAHKHFSLDEGVRRYDRVYRELGGEA